MEEPSNARKPFIESAKSLILEHVSDEHFGVSELAEAMSMSRSNLLRKIKKETELSASLYIRQVRLEKAMETLQQSSVTVSEVSYQVGFGSVSYFVKCFREHYGYPPGEVGKRAAEAQDAEKAPETEELKTEKPSGSEELKTESVDSRKKEGATGKKNRGRWIAVFGISAVVAAILVVIFYPAGSGPMEEIEKSIAVLPFKNESTDSSNLYFVNGLMESTLSNLQKIEDLRVISRTSAEKYRNSGKSIPEIAGELSVSYVVEGSGQKVGDKVLLNIQLIKADGDRPIWSEQYNRKITDIFDLQNEVAREIAKAIEAIVTPGELEIIAKKPTDNLVAYDYFLQAAEPFNTRTKEGLETAIELYKKAIEHDPEFALAYANIAIAYYTLDFFQSEKQYAEQINTYSDKALLYDSRSDVSLTSKALYYLQAKDYELALPHLVKALEYNPNSASALQMLSNYYAYSVPNTAKYLEYALMGIQRDGFGADSVAQSFSYVQLSNALLQTGFFDEALIYVDKAILYYPDNQFGPYLKVFATFAKEGDTKKAQQRARRLWEQDSTRMDILQDVAKLYYVEEDYDSAYYYYQKFDWARVNYNLSMYTHENAKIAYVFRENGYVEEAERLFEAFSAYCDEDQSIYQSANLAFKYAYLNQTGKALDELETFADQEGFQYWFLLVENDPMMAPLKDHPRFKAVVQKIKDRFWEEHNALRRTLEDQGLL